MLDRGPGAEAQYLHRDEAVWVHVPRPHPELQVASVIALEEFRAENGATRVAPGSHRWPIERQPEPDEIATAVMRPGAAVLYLGSTIHGAGANTTADHRRRGMHLSYVVGWLRTEENQFLSVPVEVVRELPRRAQELLGWVAHDAIAAGGVTGFLIPATAIPANVQIEAYHPLANLNSLLVVDTTTALPGLPPATPAEPRDVVLYTRTTGLFSVFFDGLTAGVPANVHIDALSVNAALDPQLSFDTSVTLPGVGAVDDEDVVVYAGGVFTMLYDGSAAGLASALDVDAIQTVTGPAGWLLSFDTSGSLGALTFADEDVIRYDSGLGTYAMYFDASASDPTDWPRADLNALPEPGAPAGLAAGAVLLALLTRAPGSPSRRAARSSASPPCGGSCTG